MDMEILRQILASIVRHALTTLGGALVTSGVMQSSDMSGFIGAGMVIAGVAWSWYQKVGQAEVAALLKKMTASKSHAEAVEKATVLPPADPAKITAAVSKAATGVATVLLIAFVLSFPVATAQAQVKLVKPTGNIVNDIAEATGKPTRETVLTGNIEKDAHALWKKIQSLTKADLTYAIAKATAAKTNGSAVRLQCLQAINDANDQANGAGLLNPDGTPMIRPDPAIVTAIEDVAELVDNLSPQGKLFTSCAGAAQMLKTNTLALINGIVTGAAGIAMLPAGL